MNDFIFENRTKVYFGAGCVSKYLPDILTQYGNTVLLGYGSGSIKQNGVYDEVVSILTEAGKTVIEFGGIMSNPTLEKMLEGTEIARANDVDLILAVGGGSVMDCCKSISIAARYAGDVWNDFWEEQGTLNFDPVPLGMIVTMPATGSEVNGSAVLTNTERNIKTDRDYPRSNADFALMDPNYTLSMPLRQLRAGTFDILSHIMETYFSYPIEDNVSDDISEALMRGVIRDLRAALADPNDYQARSNIMWEASMAENRIIKMGKSKDFEVHNIEHQISAYTNCNHGEGLAVLHPTYYRHIYKDGLGKFVKFAERVWGLDRADYVSDDALALAGIDALADFIRDVGLPTTLRDLGIKDELIELGINSQVDSFGTVKDGLRVIAESCYTTPGAYREIDKAEIFEILRECY
ncbi:MAG: iron-containing alcohol dehydrogenase [Mogibacterium sp.]|nr:iron-containing alcohol dehydrogenase [Mogibacterium sp.]